MQFIICYQKLLLHGLRSWHDFYGKSKLQNIVYRMKLCSMFYDLCFMTFSSTVNNLERFALIYISFRWVSFDTVSVIEVKFVCFHIPSWPTFVNVHLQKHIQLDNIYNNLPNHLICTNFGEKKIWQNLPFWSKIVKLNPCQI